MTSQKVAQALEQITSSGEQPQGYEALLRNIQKTSTPSTISADLGSIIDSVFSASLGMVATRQLLATFVSVLKAIPNNEAKIEIGQHALRALQSQANPLEETNAHIRELMATAHEEDEDFLAAATILAGIPLESSQRKVTNEDKVRCWIRITRDFLEVDDPVSAEGYLNRAKNVLYTVDDRELNLHFRLSQARIQDSRRNFLAAAQGYHDISLMSVIAEEERLHTLSMAVKCAVLAPAGPARSRTLARLYKDERCEGLGSGGGGSGGGGVEFGMLEKMYLGRLLEPAEVARFAEGLAPHQLARTADGSTVLARAVVEHNLLGVSRLYANIGFDELGALLGLDGDGAEETTARMVEQGRLVGRLDQIERVIFFEGGEASGQKGSGRAEGAVGKELRRYDANVQGLAEEVERITSALQSHYPEFVAANLVI